MFNLNLIKNIGVPLYLFIYLIIPCSAITQTLKGDFIKNLENSLNKRDLEFIRKNFRNDENQNIPKQFSNILFECLRGTILSFCAAIAKIGILRLLSL